jgi:adenine-specific DNA-methyltransferase
MNATVRPSPLRTPSRARGVYYTPHIVARRMTEWAVRDSAAHILEPSTGDGVFLRALHEINRETRAGISVSGIEYSAESLEMVVREGLLERSRAICSDFLAVEPFAVDAAVGNPPYVRLRHLPPEEADRALFRADAALGEPMDPSGSVWMPFVLHASQFLNAGGRLALVLPYDLTYVRYARPLWRFMADRFGSLRVVRVRERLFPDILQETVLLFAERFGQKTNQIRFDVFETSDDFLADRLSFSEDLLIKDVVNGERVFVEALLAPDLRTMLRESLIPRTVPVRDLATVGIGYVSGDKEFFHPTSETVDRFGLAKASLVPALTSARQLRHQGVLTSACRADNLFLPSPETGLTAGEQRYIEHGQAEGVDARYKCRVRTPWFRVPGVRIPDLVFPVFAEGPLVLLNDAGLAASNSLLCGYLKDPKSAQNFVANWYTSLTILQLELNVHALGGGVFVLVPREVSNMRVLCSAAPPDALTSLNAYVRRGELTNAFAWGDKNMLGPALGLTRNQIDLIEEGCSALTRWRTGATDSV